MKVVVSQLHDNLAMKLYCFRIFNEIIPCTKRQLFILPISADFALLEIASWRGQLLRDFEIWSFSTAQSARSCKINYLQQKHVKYCRAWIWWLSPRPRILCPTTSTVSANFNIRRPSFLSSIKVKEGRERERRRETARFEDERGGTLSWTLKKSTFCGSFVSSGAHPKFCSYFWLGDHDQSWSADLDLPQYSNGFDWWSSWSWSGSDQGESITSSIWSCEEPILNSLWRWNISRLPLRKIFEKKRWFVVHRVSPPVFLVTAFRKCER